MSNINFFYTNDNDTCAEVSKDILDWEAEHIYKVINNMKKPSIEEHYSQCDQAAIEAEKLELQITLEGKK